MIELDGSHGEGGGSVLRVAVGMSVATGTPVSGFNIRKNRRNPGLRAQHLFGLKAAAEVCGGILKGAGLGSTEIEFAPGNKWKKKIKVDIPTAGSIGLVLQVLQIACMRAPFPITVEIGGGATYGKWAPPLDYVENVLFRHLYRAGYKTTLHQEKQGFYPVGKAIASAVFEPGELKPFELVEQGEITKISGISRASEHLTKAEVAERQTKSCRAVLFKELGVSPRIKSENVVSQSPGSGITLWAETDKGNIIGSSALGERGKLAEKVGGECADFLVSQIRSGAAVDSYLADQLIPFFALCKKGSQMKTSKVTEHAKTNIWVCEQFVRCRFSVKGQVISIS